MHYKLITITFGIILIMLLPCMTLGQSKDINVERDMPEFFKLRIAPELIGKYFETLGVTDEDIISTFELSVKGLGFTANKGSENILTITFADSVIHKGKFYISVKVEYVNNLGTIGTTDGNTPVPSMDYTKEKFLSRTTISKARLLSVSNELTTNILQRARKNILREQTLKKQPIKKSGGL